MSLEAAIEDVERGMSQRKAAALHNVARSTLGDYIRSASVPHGYQVKGTSTLYNADGEVTAQWVKTTVDKEEQDRLMQTAIKALTEKIPPQKPIKSPESIIEDLCNLYTLTDAHVGMLAWHKEGGADWDLGIAEHVLMGCFEAMIDGAPKAKTGIICQLGDFLHTDFPALEPLTPVSGHSLDADGRASKIIEAAIRILRKIVDMALTKHETVHVIMAEGNHDMTSSIWLRHMFAALYGDEPRVTIDTSALPYYAFQHGEVMLGFHHGHMKKFNGLTSLFAAQFPQMWGLTTRRYAHCGHYHHKIVKEDAGMTVTQHRTLAAKDAYSSRGGYHAERGAMCVTYHKTHGEVATNNVTPEMLI